MSSALELLKKINFANRSSEIDQHSDLLETNLQTSTVSSKGSKFRMTTWGCYKSFTSAQYKAATEKFIADNKFVENGWDVSKWTHGYDNVPNNTDELHNVIWKSIKDTQYDVLISTGDSAYADYSTHAIGESRSTEFIIAVEEPIPESPGEYNVTDYFSNGVLNTTIFEKHKDFARQAWEDLTLKSSRNGVDLKAPNSHACVDDHEYSRNKFVGQWPLDKKNHLRNFIIDTFDLSSKSSEISTDLTVDRGTYYSTTYTHLGKTVKMIFLDQIYNYVQGVRTHGDAQLVWLRTALKGTQDYTIIMSPSTPADSGDIESPEMSGILSLIYEMELVNVIFVTGDLHYNETYEISSLGKSTVVRSSGLRNGGLYDDSFSLNGTSYKYCGGYVTIDIDVISGIISADEYVIAVDEVSDSSKSAKIFTRKLKDYYLPSNLPSSETLGNLNLLKQSFGFFPYLSKTTGLVLQVEPLSANNNGNGVISEVQIMSMTRVSDNSSVDTTSLNFTFGKSESDLWYIKDDALQFMEGVFKNLILVNADGSISTGPEYSNINLSIKVTHVGGVLTLTDVLLFSDANSVCAVQGLNLVQSSASGVFDSEGSPVMEGSVKVNEAGIIPLESSQAALYTTDFEIAFDTSMWYRGFSQSNIQFEIPLGYTNGVVFTYETLLSKLDNATPGLYVSVSDSEFSRKTTTFGQLSSHGIMYSGFFKNIHLGDYRAQLRKLAGGSNVNTCIDASTLEVLRETDWDANHPDNASRRIYCQWKIVHFKKLNNLTAYIRVFNNGSFGNWFYFMSKPIELNGDLKHIGFSIVQGAFGNIRYNTF